MKPFRNHCGQAFAGIVALLVLAGCEQGAAPELTREEISAEVRSAMAMDSDPCEDFYQYTCGAWLETTELPADESRWGRSFSEIAKSNREFLREYLESGRAASDPRVAKLDVFYSSCMNEEAVEQAGLEPLRPWLDKIADVADPESFLRATGEIYVAGVQVPFDTMVTGDFKDSKRNIGHFFQGGLGLPDRDYYFEERHREMLDEYREHVRTMLGLLGETDEQAAAHADAVLAFETDLARDSRPAAEMRDFEKLYNKLDKSGLKELTPQLPWDVFFEALGYPDVVDLNIATPEFFEALERGVRDAAADTLQAYLRWHLVNVMADQLPAAFVEANFNFFGATLSGQDEMRPRWRRCVAHTDAALGEMLGQAYVAEKFPGDSKQIALEMIHDVEAAFEGGLDQLSWMDDVTRGRALEKMAAIKDKIGYPDEWRDYSKLELERDAYFANSIVAAAFEFQRNADKIGEPLDPVEWGMTPAQVNAYYHPIRNEIVFPAGILQPPFFHRDHPAAMNYGGIGMVMSHELTHGFDDSGRKFDRDGNQVEWWEPEASERFEERAACVETLYDGYEVEPGLTLNGKLTLGENIADLGGVKEAYRAYHLQRSRHGDDGQLIEELTDDQLFFVAFAQTWCQKITPERARVLAQADPHSAARYRVIGPLTNLPEFAEAFSCEAGTPMNPIDKCEVW